MSASCWMETDDGDLHVPLDDASGRTVVSVLLLEFGDGFRSEDSLRLGGSLLDSQLPRRLYRRRLGRLKFGLDLTATKASEMIRSVDRQVRTMMTRLGLTSSRLRSHRADV